MGEFVAAWNALTDLSLAGYPIVLLWGVQMPRRTKVGACCLLGIGIFTAGCAAAKGWSIHLVTQGQGDITYLSAPLWFLDMTELWTCLLAASIPPMWPLVKHLLLRGRGSPARVSRHAARQAKSISLVTIGRATRGRSSNPTDERSDSWERILDLKNQPTADSQVAETMPVHDEETPGSSHEN